MDPLTLATTAVGFLSPYLVKAGEKAAEKIGEKLPETVGKVWNAITARFKGKPAAEEAVKDLVTMPDDEDNQAAFRKELRKVLEAEPAFAAEFARLLTTAQSQAGDTNIITGSGAVATQGGVAAGEGGIAIGGDVHGNVSLGKSDKKE
jgi:hypothetical protein